MPFCNKCGNEIAENTKFCPKCGGNQQGGQNPSDNTSPTVSEKMHSISNIDIAAVAAEKAHTISMSGFILICLCFLLPFITVQCGNNKVLELKGYHLVSGYELQNKLTQQSDEVESNPCAIIMLISALVGIILCNRLKNKKGILKFFIINLAALILLMLRIIHLLIIGRLDQKGALSIVTVDYGIGYWLCVFLSFALIAFAFYMIKSTKRQAIIGSIPLAVICFLIGLCFVTNPLAMSPRAKAIELGSAAGTWSKLQEAYIVEVGEVGDCTQIGYTLPGNGETAYFTYECGVLQNGNAYWIAKNKVDLGECKAGSYWVVNINKESEIMLKQPDDKNCTVLTPNFCSLATSKKCQ
ncbi:MAG: zinc-ribbon domain-containing protein [Candidatus Fibromonas sp.]|nr:zinc-ribbon domain-containing protein [Candidatus Fibromonas sp.]